MIAFRGRKGGVADARLFERLHPHCHDFLLYPVAVDEEDIDDDVVSQEEGEGEGEGEGGEEREEGEWITWVSYPEPPEEECTLRQYFRELRSAPLHVAVSEWIRLLVSLLEHLDRLAEHGVHVHALLSDTHLHVSRVTLSLFLPCATTRISVGDAPLPPVDTWFGAAAVAAAVAGVARVMAPAEPGPAMVRASVDTYLRRHGLPHVFPRSVPWAAGPVAWYGASVAALFRPYATPVPLVRLCTDWLLPDCARTPRQMLDQLNALIV